MNLLRCCVVILPLLLVASCSDEKSQRLEQKVATLSNEVAELSIGIKGAQYQLGQHRSELNNLNDDKMVREMYAPRQAVLDPTKKNFTPVERNGERFFIRCQDTTPYLDGYKVALAVGNPSSALYNGFKLTAVWGKALPVKKWFDAAAQKEWQSSLRTNEFTFTDELRPGTWNKVEIILSPAKSDELEYLAIGLQTGAVRLREQP